MIKVIVGWTAFAVIVALGAIVAVVVADILFG